VNPIVQISGITQVVCSGGSIVLIPNSTNGIVPDGTTYKVVSESNIPPTNFTYLHHNGFKSQIEGTFTNTLNVPQSITFNISSTLANGCTNNGNFTVVITVNPLASITSMTTVTCEGVMFQVTPVNGTNGTLPAGTLYSWSLPSVSGGITGGATGSGASTITGTLSNPTSATQTAVYTVTPISGSCTGSSFTLSVTVNPHAAITQMNTTVCSGLTFRVTPTDVTNGQVPTAPVGTTTYTWSAPTMNGLNGMASQLSGSADIFGTLNNTTNIDQSVTYTVTPSTSYSVGGNCIGAPFSVVVTVNPIVIISGITQVTCNGVAFGLTPTASNGIIPDGTTYINTGTSNVESGIGYSGFPLFPDYSSSITGIITNSSNSARSLTLNIQPILLNGCANSANFTVVVVVNPTASITTMKTVVCDGVLFQLTPVQTTNGRVPAGTLYSWSAPSFTSSMTGGNSGSNQLSISGTLQNLTNSIQTATYQVVPVNSSALGSCVGATFTVNVGVNPNAEIV
ncbi:MAG: hypothetical protein EBX50_20400, partial [Chitinophagia bacterium]|nr:hypothetical protein [Chitinophagia bacterium]